MGSQWPCASFSPYLLIMVKCNWSVEHCGSTCFCNFYQPSLTFCIGPRKQSLLVSLVLFVVLSMLYFGHYLYRHILPTMHTVSLVQQKKPLLWVTIGVHSFLIYMWALLETRLHVINTCCPFIICTMVSFPPTDQSKSTCTLCNREWMEIVKLYRTIPDQSTHQFLLRNPWSMSTQTKVP
jgi:hypothetical protein